MPTPTHKAVDWLIRVCAYFDLLPETITNNRQSFNNYVVSARYTWLALCVRDNIDLYRLSEYYGKHRTTFYVSFKNYRGESCKKYINEILKNESTTTTRSFQRNG